MTAYILNLADLAFTLHALGHGACELNPLMGSPGVMIAWKVVVVGVALWWLQRYRVRWALRGAVVLFGVVDLWHIGNLIAIHVF